MPDQVVAPETQNTQVQPVTSAAPTATPAAAPPSASTPSLPSGSASEPSRYTGVRDTLKEQWGEQYASQFADDNAAMQHLLLSAQQAARYQQYDPYLQEYMRDRDAINAWKKEQQAKQQAQQAEAAKRWRPEGVPDWDSTWHGKVRVDPQTGRLVSDDPTLLPRYRAGQEYAAGFLEKLAFDPIGTIQPGLEQLIEQKAGELIQRHLGSYRETADATDFLRQNANWMYLRNQEGQMIPDSMGRPQLSQDGQALTYYLAEAEQLGIRGIEAQKRYAVRGMQFDHLARQQQQNTTQQQAQVQGQQQQQAWVAARNKPNAVPADEPLRNADDLKRVALKKLKAAGFSAEQIPA